METIADLRSARVEGRCLLIQGVIDANLVESFQEQVEAIYENAAEAEFVVELNTPGGDMDCMNTVYTELATLAATDAVWLVGRGIVASAGIYLLGAVPRQKRVALPFTKFFHHLFDSLI